MKRRTSPSPHPPSTPLTPQLRQSFNTAHNNRISRNPQSIPAAAAGVKWKPLNITKSELYLPLTFPTGQTFRWKETGPSQYTGPVGPHLFSLKQLEDVGVVYFCHFTDDENAARTALLDFLNTKISLSAILEEFKAADERFAELAHYLDGARVLRQDPLECLIQFICSSNNNIQRITKMVDFISAKGRFLGSVGEYDFFEFPSLETLGLVSEAELREAGFGYRAQYIVRTVKALLSKPGRGVEWLASLRKLDLREVVSGLCRLHGVGPKVAACVALFSLDQHHAVPVDTHVWQIATRYLVPELAGARPTPKHCRLVEDAFVAKYGKYAGWAQTLIFISGLPSQKALLPSNFWNTDAKSSAIPATKETKNDSGTKRKNG